MTQKYEPIPDLETGGGGGFSAASGTNDDGKLVAIHGTVSSVLDRLDDGGDIIVEAVTESSAYRVLVDALEPVADKLSVVVSKAKGCLSSYYDAAKERALPDETSSRALSNDTQTAAEKYPEANEQELKLLMLLDGAKEKATPEINLPRLNPEDIGIPLSLREFFGSLKLATVSLIVILMTALPVVLSGSPVAIALFPYYACLLVFVASVPATRKRLSEQFMAIFENIEEVQANVNDKISAVLDGGTAYVASVQDNIDKVLEPIRPKLDQVTKLESALRKINPNIDIPDVSDIEEKLDDAADSIRDVFDSTKKAADLTKHIPKPLRSRINFEVIVTFPALLVFLILQLVAVFASSGGGSSAAGAVVETAAGSAATAFNPGLIAAAFKSYFAVVIQLGISFFSTQSSFLAKGMNNGIDKVECDVNEVLNRIVEPVFKNFFVKRMEEIKAKILELIKKMEMIEGPLKKLTSIQIPKVPKGLSKMTDSFKSKVEMPKMDLPKMPSFKNRF